MFGRSKGKASDAPVGETASGATGLETGRSAVTGTGGTSPTEIKPSQGAGPPQDAAATRRPAMTVRHSLVFAQIVSMLMRSQQHRRYPIGALQWLVLPPLLTGQFSLAEARSKEKGVSTPIAVALWARVSPEVDKRLSETLDKPVQLRPREWRSGDILWLVEAIGDRRALPQFLKHLGETTFKGCEVKVRSRGADGKVTVKTLAEMAAAK